MERKLLHYGFIITFSVLYIATAFVSFYHAIEFFNLSNNTWLSVILSLVAEIGQATVLFSLLMSKNKQNIMPWVVMIILTALQVIGNVYSCYVFIEEANSERFIFFQKSILFFVEESQETMKVIVAWVTGSLLPIIALCLTSLVADTLHNSDDNYTISEEVEESDIIVEEISDNNQDALLDTNTTIIQPQPIAQQNIVSDTTSSEEFQKAKRKPRTIIKKDTNDISTINSK